MSADLAVFLSSRFRIFVFAFACLMSLAGLVQALPEGSPILISEPGSTRALFTIDGHSGATNPQPGQVVRFYVTGLDLMEGEGATAFRAELEDARRYRYPLQIVSFERSTWLRNVYEIAVRLDNVYEGEHLVRVTWRGMSSNRTRLPIGEGGSRIEDDPGSVPTPIANLETRTAKRSLQERYQLPWNGDVVRFMSQATFGPNAALELKLRRLGYSAWLEQQMDETAFLSYTYPDYPAQPTTPIPTCDGNTQPTDVPITCFRDRYTMYPLQNWFFKEALYNEDQQLRRRVSWSLHQIFVISGRVSTQPNRMLPYIQTLDRNAFGNYRVLLEQITLNPGMGQYLDMATSTAQDPNENYAREILQLFSIGLDMLNQDGTPMLDSQGNRIPTYNQETIVNFAKVFTGWTYCNQQCGISQPGFVNFRDPMIPNPALHDTSAKVLLQYPGGNPFVPAGLSPAEDLEAALNNIFHHPNTAPFISKLLIQQLVTSNPTPAYVGRVAAKFRNNGNGMRGDMKAVIKAILLDPEARGNIKTDPNYGHLREPVLYLTQLLRPFNPTANSGASAGCNGLSDGVINGVTLPLDQDVWNPPTVFNYYPMDYIIPNTPLNGPQFQIFSTGTALKRPNAVNQFFPVNSTAVGGIAATTGAAANTPCGTRVDVTRYQNLAAADTTGGQLIDAVNRELMNGSMSPQVRAEISTAVQAVASTNPLKRARTAIYLAATSPQYQVQR
jgi:uncharacterized protein (DUF1800 family)